MYEINIIMILAYKFSATSAFEILFTKRVVGCTLTIDLRTTKKR